MSNLESRFTPSRDFCPHPEYWHSPDSEATEKEVSGFIGALVRLIQPEYVVETGTYLGHTTIEIARALTENGHGKVVTIERDGIFHERAKWAIIEAAKEDYGTLEPFLYSVRLVHGNTMDFVPEQNIDLAFFDSWQEGRHLEFMRFYEMGKLQKNAIVVFHDTAPHHQVRKHIFPLDSDGYIHIIDFHTPRGLILGQVL